MISNDSSTLKSSDDSSWFHFNIVSAAYVVLFVFAMYFMSSMSFTIYTLITNNKNTINNLLADKVFLTIINANLQMETGMTYYYR